MLLFLFQNEIDKQKETALDTPLIPPIQSNSKNENKKFETKNNQLGYNSLTYFETPIKAIKPLEKKKFININFNINFPEFNEKDKIIFSKISDEKNSDLSKMNKMYTCEDIKKILKEKEFPQELVQNIDDKFITSKDKESVYLFSTKIKRRRRDEPLKKERKMLGRKRANDKTERNHNKYNSDNIIKKCKSIFFSQIIEYINNFIKEYKSIETEEATLLKLDYNDCVNRLKKENELKILDMKLKEIGYFKTSMKYKLNKDRNINQIIINKILDQEKDNERINQLLNMTFSDWIDIFTYKTKREYEFKFDGLIKVLEKIKEGFNEEYFSRFIFYLFNYQSWFMNRKGRKRRKKIFEE